MNNMNQQAKDERAGKGTGEGIVRLSPRLKAVADYVRQGSRIADVGTDHGYIPIFLAQTGRAARAVAMDVREGPLERAREHIREYEAGMPAGHCPIEARLSDGLESLRPGEADTVIIAGMGGGLIMRIMEQGRRMWESVDHWILSPQSDQAGVRRYLEDNGFLIKHESMVRDEGKYYTVMSVARGDAGSQRPVWRAFGKCLLERRDPVLREYLEKEKSRVEEILKTLGEQGSEPVTESREKAGKALLQELDLIKEAQDEMQ